MSAILPALLVATLGLLGPGDDPEVLKVDVNTRTDHIKLAPSGDPPTYSALPIERVVDPATKRPYDASNDSLGCAPGDLRRAFRLEKSDVLLGEPVLVEFRIALDGEGHWDEGWGGTSRGLGREGRIFFLLRREDGSWVPDIFEGHEMQSFGGIGGVHRVERDKPKVDWYAVQQWCAIDRPGAYDLYAFHWGGGGGLRPIGIRRRVEAALPAGIGPKVRVDGGGQVFDRETGEPWSRPFIHQVWRGDPLGADEASPVAASVPDFVKAKLPGAAFASDYAHFRLTIRAGDDRQRRAMAERWIKEAADPDRESREWGDAAEAGMALARQDDFLPELETRLRKGEGPGVGPLLLGLAMRDDARAVDLLFKAGGPGAIEAMTFLRPGQVPDAIPRLIDQLTSEDHTARAAADEALRGWTGQAFGHAWEGYDWMRPTPEEGRRMQALYRPWWEQARATFRPRFKAR